MTAEQYEILQENEYLFYTSTQRNYVMFGSVERKQKLSQIYAEVFNKKSNMMSGCGSCALREMKALANEYYQYKQQQENKPKRGRRKKEE